MHPLLPGIRRFQSDVMPALAERFSTLSQGQQPHTLFITCSDSRVDPSLITQAGPGELFVLRNAGNLVPPHGADLGSASAVEYAVNVLGVDHIVVCGHSSCGAMGGLLAPHTLASLPAVAQWVTHAAATRHAVAGVQGDRVDAAINHNALTQLDNLRTHPCVAQAEAEGRVTLHAWVYRIGTGQVDFLTDAPDPS